MIKDLLLFVKRDLIIAVGSKGFFYKLISLFLTINLLLFFADIGNQQNNLSIVVALSLSSTILGGHLIQHDLSSGHLYQILLTDKTPITLVISKIATSFLLLFICLSIGLFINYIASNHVIGFLELLVYLILCTVLSLLLIFSSLITMNSRKPEAINMVIIFPLLISFIIYSSAILQSSDTVVIINDLQIISGMSMLILPVTVWGCVKSLTRI